MARLDEESLVNGFKVVNATRKGNLVAIELRSLGGQITPATRGQMRRHDDVLRVVPGGKPSKVFILTFVGYERKGGDRAELVRELTELTSVA